jgi:hypothetical protein
MENRLDLEKRHQPASELLAPGAIKRVQTQFLFGVFGFAELLLGRDVDGNDWTNERSAEEITRQFH